MQTDRSRLLHRVVLGGLAATLCVVSGLSLSARPAAAGDPAARPPGSHDVTQPVDPPPPQPPVNPGQGPAAGPGAVPPAKVRLKDAREDLNHLIEFLKSKAAVAPDIVAAIDAVKKAYDGLAPDLVKDSATGVEAEDTKGFDEAKKQFQGDVEKEWLHALDLVKVKSETNERDDVNIKAAQVLSGVREAARERVVKALVLYMDKTVPTNQKAYKIPPALYDEVMKTLGTIGDAKNGAVEYFHTWIVFDNTGDRPERIRAAFEGMLHLKNLSGKDRYDFVEPTVTCFSPVEASAEHYKPGGKSNPKAVWEILKPAVIKMLQHFTGEPKAKDGALIASVVAFEVWFREHKNVQKDPWAK